MKPDPPAHTHRQQPDCLPKRDRRTRHDDQRVPHLAVEGHPGSCAGRLELVEHRRRRLRGRRERYPIQRARVERRDRVERAAARRERLDVARVVVGRPQCRGPVLARSASGRSATGSGSTYDGGCETTTLSCHSCGAGEVRSSRSRMLVMAARSSAGECACTDGEADAITAVAGGHRRVSANGKRRERGGEQTWARRPEKTSEAGRHALTSKTAAALPPLKKTSKTFLEKSLVYDIGG